MASRQEQEAAERIQAALQELERLTVPPTGQSPATPWRDFNGFWQKAKENDPPWNRLTLSHFIGGWPLIILTIFVLHLAALGMAYVLVSFKSLFF